jgi:hypothetical protein
MIIPLPGGTQFDTGTDPTVVSVDDVTLHTPLALLRLIERWKGKPNLAAILASYTDQLQLLENALWDIITARLVDYAEGAQLDAIGRIVGEIRQGQNDAQYRARLRVRIRINQSFGTAEDVIIVLQMLDAALFAFVESGLCAFRYCIFSAVDKSGCCVAGAENYQTDARSWDRRNCDYPNRCDARRALRHRVRSRF